MGGAVNVFVRDNDRNFYRMSRWTNTLSSFLTIIGHVDEEDNLSEYMKPWLGMKDDWEKNKHTNLFEYNMTPCYFPAPTRICNGEYGLVFVDYITKSIISYQDYSGIGKIDISTISVMYTEDMIVELFRIANKGKVSYTPNWGSEQPIIKIDNMDHMAKILDDDNYGVCFLIDNSPWTIEHGMKHEINFKDMKAKIDAILEQ
jgi:hypothetical protein